MKRLALLGVQNIRLTGGEPLFRKDILEIARLAKNIFLKFSLFSNLSFIDNKIFDEIIILGPEIFWTTVLDYRSNVHDSLTKVSGSHKLTISSIKILLNNGIKVGVQIPMSKFNYLSLLDTIDFIQQLGVEIIKVLPIFLIGRAQKNKAHLLPPLLWNQIIDPLLSLRFESKRYTKIKISNIQNRRMNEKSSLKDCLLGVKRIFNVDHRGRIFSCCALMGDKRFALFNILMPDHQKKYKVNSFAKRKVASLQLDKNTDHATFEKFSCPALPKDLYSTKLGTFSCPLRYIQIGQREKFRFNQ